MNTEPHGVLDDPDRLGAIHAAGLADPSADPVFHRMAALTRRVLDVPVALVSVVGADRQSFLGCSTVSRPWEDITDTPLSHSFCRHAVESADPLVVDDARVHPEFRDHPAVDDLKVVAYAGIPLITSENRVLGTVCAIDHEQRRWSDSDLDLLREISELALARIELRSEVRRRRKTEAELDAQADRYRALIESMDETITVIDGQGTIRYESQSVERIFGHDPERLVGRSVLELVHPDDQDAIGDALGRILEEPGSTRIGTVRFKHADGGWRDVEYMAKNLLHLPTVEGIVVNARDVTKRRALEEAARQAEKLDALGRLAAGVAHDFNNILGAIRVNADLALAEAGEEGEVRTDLEEIKASVDRGTRITKQFLGFSRSKPTEPEILDPAVVVLEMDGLLRRLIAGDVELLIEAREGVHRIRISRAELEQVILNLAVNARDALEAGGRITVRVQGPVPLPERTIPMEQQRHEHYVELGVADTGSGIPDDKRERIFEPFFTTKAEGEGTGLGLSTVYGITVRYGGRIGLESTVGVGTTFSIFLPTVDADRDPALRA